MKRRVFIAVNLPEKLKKRLKEYREKFDYLPVRWTKPDSLHLTLVFIGYVSNEQMLEICRVAREVAAEQEAFFLTFKKIILAPAQKAPRMIWLTGEVDKNLSELKKLLEKKLLEADTGFYRPDNKESRPHITLARIKMEQWRRAEAEIDLPEIEQSFQVQSPVNSIEVMESDLRSDGAEYLALESCTFSG
jgi:2'-5' RNA ligase